MMIKLLEVLKILIAAILLGLFICSLFFLAALIGDWAVYGNWLL